MVKKVRKKSKKKRKPRGGRVVAEVAEAYGIKVSQDPRDRTLSPNEAGSVLGVTGEAVKQWIYHRRLPAVKLSNGYWRITVRDLEEFIKNRQEISKRTILLVGTDAQHLQARAKDLEQTQHEVLIANGLADALLKALDFFPSLFIIDLTGFEDGWQLAERIRSSRNIRNTGILFISKTTLKDDKINRALELSIQGCLTRDISGKGIRQEVDKLLSFSK